MSTNTEEAVADDADEEAARAAAMAERVAAKGVQR